MLVLGEKREKPCGGRKRGKLQAGKKGGKTCSRWKERQELKKVESEGKRLAG